MAKQRSRTQIATPTPTTHVDSTLLQRLQALLVDMEESSPAETSVPPSPQSPTGDTNMILAAIESRRTSLLVLIDHLVEECNLIRNDLYKMQGAPLRT